jgi:hypothetical protein
MALFVSPVGHVVLPELDGRRTSGRPVDHRTVRRPRGTGGRG